MEERRAKREEDMRKEREEAEERRRQKGEEWREAAGLREREATLAQQRELKVVNAALLTRLPKFEGKQVPGTFIQALEKQLRDNEIPEAKWLGALESCLRGKALSTYWNLVEARDRDDYASAREAILKCLGPAITRRLDQVAMCKWLKDESVADVWEESVQHVKSFVTAWDTAAEVEFKWILTWTLAKCKREYADTVWKQRPKSVPEGIAAIREWEHKYGPAARVFVRKPEVFFDRKVKVPPRWKCHLRFR